MLTLLRIGWTNLRRDRVAQALTFLLPIVFFSIFASVFGSRGGENMPPRRRSRWSTRTAPSSAGASSTALGKETALRVRAAAPAPPRSIAPAAERLVRNGDVPVAVVIPEGWAPASARAASAAGTAGRAARGSVGSGRAADGAGAAAEGRR